MKKTIQAAGLAALACASGQAAAEYGFDPAIAVAPDMVGAIAMKVADMDGDGRDDVVVLASGAQAAYRDKVVVFRSMPGGGFAAPRILDPGATTSNYNSRMTVGDVNGDGRPDILVSTSNNFGYRLHVLLNGTGGFTRVDNTMLAPYEAMTLEDIDGDGDVDLLSHSASGSYSFRFAHGDGAGGFANEQQLQLPYAYAGIQLVDIDGDGRSDVVYQRENALAARLRTPTGFASAETVLLPHNYFTNYNTRFVFGDFNGDGRTDIASYRGSYRSSVLFYPQDAYGRFRAKLHMGENTSSFYTLHVADVDRDGRDDIVAMGYNALQVRLGTARGLAQALDFPVASMSEVAFGDIDGDGDGDVVVRNGNGGAYYLPGAPVPFEGDLAVSLALVDGLATVRVENTGVTVNGLTEVTVALSSRLGLLATTTMPVGCYNYGFNGEPNLRCTVSTLQPGGAATFAIPFSRTSSGRPDMLKASARLGTYSSWVDLRKENNVANAMLRVPGSP